MKKIIYLLSLTSVMGIFSSCEMYVSPERGNNVLPEVDYYVNQYDQISDKGQYWLPEWAPSTEEETPIRYFNCVYLANGGTRNNINETDHNVGLQAHLMAQSITGLVNSNIDKTFQTAVWLRDESALDSYKQSLSYLNSLGINEFGSCTAKQLTEYGELQNVINQYILVDVVNNPESAIYAAVASPHLNAYIVDVRDQDIINPSHKQIFDARNKSTQDAWNEYKDKVNKKGLVVMPVQTGELRDFAIKNKFFVINLNKVQGNPSKGQNAELFKEILSTLEPNSPVFGWEQGVGEDVFVEQVSNYGHMMVPYDWVFNTTLTSYNYKSRQKSILAKVSNPQFIDFNSPEKKYVTFYLSDGDNVQWMMNNFDSESFYLHPEAQETKITFGFPFANLAMIAPTQFENLLAKQKEQNTMIENLGGGYYYVDVFGKSANRKLALEKIAKNIASHMRQHRVKILGLVAKDVDSDSAKEAYAEYIKANDQLEGIVVIQYDPYAGGAGQIMWFENSKGYRIPVVTVKYSIWNFGEHNQERQGTPAYIASKINQESLDSPFSVVSVHAWSKFTDIGESNDLVGESAPGGAVVGAGAAKLCMNRLGDDVKVVNMHELIWRIRMYYEPEQTKEILSTVF